MKYVRQFAGAGVLLAILALNAACPVDGGETVVAVTGVSLNKETLSLVAGDTETLIAAVAPEDAANKAVTWASSAPAVAAVNDEGLVSAVAPGTEVITVTTADGGKTADCTVTVTPVPVAVVGIMDVPAGEMPGIPLTLTGTVAPANATYKTIVWSVKNAGATGASINGNTLTTTAEGTVEITATIANGTAMGTAYSRDFSITIGFATPAQYREMILATPDAANTVTITGSSSYGGAFPANRTVTVSPFKIAKYETTYELWYEVKQWATGSARGANRYVFGNAGREGRNGTAGATPQVRQSWNR
jgi:uncharacterized protein YjdB